MYNIEIPDCNDEFKTVKLADFDPMGGDLFDPALLDLNRLVSKREVEMAVDHAKNNKAVGIDLISNEIMKNDKVIIVLHKLISMCFRVQKLPDVWKNAIVHPIPKERGSLIDPLKYRDLALQSCVYKIFSNTVNSRLVEYLTHKDVIADSQNGFWKNRSCLHHIHSLITIIRNKSNKGAIHTIFIDFRQAFDIVDRSLLYCRLVEYGVGGTALNLIQEMYSETWNQVRINQQLTPRFTSKNGLKQGDNLSPTAFSVYINDLLNELNNSGLDIQLTPSLNVNNLAYADDIVLISDNPIKLQKMLDIVAAWCKNWRVLINVAKTKAMTFGKHVPLGTQCEYRLGNEVIEVVQKYCYLGINLNCNLNMSETVEQLANASSKALGALIGKTKAHLI